MFEGFALETVDVGEVVLRVRHGGKGTPVVLLHGHPRTHMTWHRVAPLLAARHTGVCPDLRGYGRSTLPPDQPGHAQSSKRAMAADVVLLMRALGHETFSVVGHDRGALVALRAALDHPDRVTGLVIMDGLPVVEHLERLNERFVRTWWHWWFMGQTEKPAERVICADPDAWYETPPAEVMGAEAHADNRHPRRSRGDLAVVGVGTARRGGGGLRPPPGRGGAGGGGEGGPRVPQGRAGGCRLSVPPYRFSQRACARQSGTRDSSSAQKRGEWSM